MNIFSTIITILAIIAWGIYWGYVTDTYAHNKGYNESWFWWGFFFTWMAFILVFIKPNLTTNKMLSKNIAQNDKYHDNKVLDAGGWKCSCGKVNPAYTGTCSCGCSKE